MRTPEQEARYQALLKKCARWDKLSYAEQQRRMAVWRHNSLLGHVAMARSGMRAVQEVHTTSDRAKELALDIEGLLELLNAELRENRIDPRA